MRIGNYHVFETVKYIFVNQHSLASLLNMDNFLPIIDQLLCQALQMCISIALQKQLLKRLTSDLGTFEFNNFREATL